MQPLGKRWLTIPICPGGARTTNFISCSCAVPLCCLLSMRRPTRLGLATVGAPPRNRLNRDEGGVRASTVGDSGTWPRSVSMHQGGAARYNSSPTARRVQVVRLVNPRAPRLKLDILQRRPFMPPSGHPQQVGSVLPGTMVADARQDAGGTIGASSAMDCTEGTSVHNSLPLPGTEHWEDFNPLPLRVESPINVDVLEHFLTPYPCPGTRDYLLRGFRHGFDIGFRGSFNEVDSRPRNLRSARYNPEGVTEAIAKELRRGHTSGPFPFPPFTHTLIVPRLEQRRSLTDR